MGGVVYLLVRKTRRCWPDTRSCCDPKPLAVKEGVPITERASPPCSPTQFTIDCPWTHFHSVLDGSKDGAPTFFEVPLGASKYYISIFAPRQENLDHGVIRARYRFLMLADIGAFPRPGLQGRLHARQTGETTLDLSWDQATFLPLGVSGLKSYVVYSSLLLAAEEKQSTSVMLSPSKIMNSVCGLEQNAVPYGLPLSDLNCVDGRCTNKITGIIPRRRYLFNIIATSYRNHSASYSGIIVDTDWDETTQLLTDRVTSLVAAICGTVFGIVIIGYLWIVKLYN